MPETSAPPHRASASASDAADTAANLSDFAPLGRAERLVLRALARGDIAKVGLRRPAAPSPEVTVRAAFLGHLARAGGRSVPTPAARRLQLVGAWISGHLNLVGATVPMSLWFYRCGFAAAPELDGARIEGDLSLAACALPGLHAQACHVVGTLALNAGCVVSGELRLRGVHVAGDLDAGAARLGCSEGGGASAARPLVLDGAVIAGDVRLDEGFESVGEVRLVSARLGGDLEARHARMSGVVDARGVRRDALNLERIEVQGDVRLASGFVAAGPVRLRRARIEGDLDCRGALFDVASDAAWGDDGGALRLDHARIAGALILRQLAGPVPGVSLADASVGVIDDDADAWGEQLVLDGLRYRRFADTAPVHPAIRLAWLGRQSRLHLGDDHRPQPWLQLIRVLRDMGHPDAARAVAMAREVQLRRSGRVGAAMPRGLRWLARLCHATFGALAGYGYRPVRLVLAMAVAWLVCGAVYEGAAGAGLIAPTQALLFDPVRVAPCRGEAGAAGRPDRPARWTDCEALQREYPRFSAMAYSLDLLLPLADLGQARHWMPVRSAERHGLQLAQADVLRWLTWLEGLFGWLAGLLLAASLLGLTQRDRNA